jgi:very-short-patch-repair endonuclease
MGKDWAEVLHFQMHSLGLRPETEYQFHPTRKWRSDFAFPHERVLVEFEGGVYTQGRHSRGRGFEKDCEKYNAAGLMGYIVFRFTGSMVKSGVAVSIIEQAVENGRQVKTR